MVAFSAVLSSAALLLAVPALANPGPLTGLLARQVSPGGALVDPASIPPSCQNSCTGLQTSLTGCTSIQCLCGSSVAKGLGDCLNCAVGTQGSALNATYAQSLVDTFINGCKQGGVNVSPITIKGGSSGGSGSGGSSGGSSGSTTSGAMRPTAIGGAVLGALALVLTFA